MNLEPISAAPLHSVDSPVMRQRWSDLTFLHWSCDPGIVRPLVPAALDLDLYDGAAWIGLVPFRIEALTRPNVRPAPWLSTFPETNVRTYAVDAQGRRGVWFFSLDAARLLAVGGARLAYALPYFWARMSVQRKADIVAYHSKRFAGHGACDVQVQAGDRINPTELEIFLTARFCLFARQAARLYRADIEHPPWPLQRARVLSLRQSLTTAAGLPEFHDPPFAHFAASVDVLVGGLTRIRSL